MSQEHVTSQFDDGNSLASVKVVTSSFVWIKLSVGRKIYYLNNVFLIISKQGVQQNFFFVNRNNSHQY